MIRINLLPVKQVKKVQAGQRQLGIFAIGLLVLVALMFFLYQLQQGVVDEKQRKVNLLTTVIGQLKKDVGDFDALKARHDELMAQKKTIEDLQKGRTGPVWIMRELSDILTPGKGPTSNQQEYEELLRTNPNAGYNPRWNPHRLWLTTVTETGGMIRLVGNAKDYDDVAEFNKRINLSRFFKDDFLERNQQKLDSKLNQRIVGFSLRARVVY